MGLPWYYHLLVPDFVMHNEAYDAIESQQSQTESLALRVARLEAHARDLEQHIRGLEALLAANGIVPPPEPEALPPPESAVFPARTAETVACPRCGKKQRGDRDLCYCCKLPFRYEQP